MNTESGLVAGVMSLFAIVLGIMGHLVKSSKKAEVSANDRIATVFERFYEGESRATIILAKAVSDNTAALDRHTAMLGPLVKANQSMAESVKKLVEDHHKDITDLVKDFNKSER